MRLDLPESWRVWEPERFLKIRLRGTKWVGHKKEDRPRPPRNDWMTHPCASVTLVNKAL